jgi:hypothetical protein
VTAQDAGVDAHSHFSSCSSLRLLAVLRFWAAAHFFTSIFFFNVRSIRSEMTRGLSASSSQHSLVPNSLRYLPTLASLSLAKLGGGQERWPV